MWKKVNAIEETRKSEVSELKTRMETMEKRQDASDEKLVAVSKQLETVESKVEKGFTDVLAGLTAFSATAEKLERKVDSIAGGGGGGGGTREDMPGVRSDFETLPPAHPNPHRNRGIKCWYCGNTGHPGSMCRKKKRDEEEKKKSKQDDQDRRQSDVCNPQRTSEAAEQPRSGCVGDQCTAPVAWTHQRSAQRSVL